jgi:hypothetical protein
MAGHLVSFVLFGARDGLSFGWVIWEAGNTHVRLYILQKLGNLRANECHGLYIDGHISSSTHRYLDVFHSFS